MNKNGKIALQIMIILVIVVITSALLLLLVRSGVLEVKETSGADVLNTEFIPLAREGFLAIKDFKFCKYVDNAYECIGENPIFNLGDDVYFTFVVESSTYSGEVRLVENYRIKGPAGEILLEVDEKNNFYFNASSKKTNEEITFRDYFTVGEDMPEGDYILELIINNPLLNKQAKLMQQFEMQFTLPKEYIEE
ncbi:MAG: hypothetical protein ABIA37_04250 [Candidatus Woesearchaeota archaeon]